MDENKSNWDSATRTPVSHLTLAEIERLSKLAEECGEVVQMVGKILVHGYESFSPFDLDQETNRSGLLREIANISAVVGLMLKNGDLPHPPTNEQIDEKMKDLYKYTHHQTK